MCRQPRGLPTAASTCWHSGHIHWRRRAGVLFPAFPSQQEVGVAGGAGAVHAQLMAGGTGHGCPMAGGLSTQEGRGRGSSVTSCSAKRVQSASRGARVAAWDDGHPDDGGVQLEARSVRAGGLGGTTEAGFSCLADDQPHAWAMETWEGKHALQVKTCNKLGRFQSTSTPRVARWG